MPNIPLILIVCNIPNKTEVTNNIVYKIKIYILVKIGIFLIFSMSSFI